MFTGLVEEKGSVIATEENGDSMRLTIAGSRALEGIQHGDSISVSGVCLTAVKFNSEHFTADVMAQTLAMTTLGTFVPGTAVNLERAAQVGDRLGGHIVQGHIDGTAQVLSLTEADAWRVVRFSLPGGLAPLVVDKGSITVDGVSLTVSAVSPAPISEIEKSEQWFEVSLIPETLSVTTLGDVRVGDFVNVETDILARHIVRASAFSSTTPPQKDS
ncbi:riboflavin synthase [Lysinibacter sp. HNR]|uniref:riboflavin synthase n=1 Tax=Lysinibacter sp. HNR TaxID=3031408 RepID=UPI0024357BBC|nr:riboflavin synthase [Lysinibacter sp. HNR]WGD37051.1 riboflavin synthase [Lysinibacter sp. HNR]